MFHGVVPECSVTSKSGQGAVFILDANDSNVQVTITLSFMGGLGFPLM